MYEEIEPLYFNFQKNTQNNNYQNNTQNNTQKNQNEIKNIDMLPKELFEVTLIVPNLYLSSKYGEKYYDKFDKIINLNYPENNVHYDSIAIDKNKFYKIGIEDNNSDIYKYFDLLSALILTSLKERKKVLVHCHAGISRSTTIILAFLIKYANMSLKDAFKKVKEKRSIVQPNEYFLTQLSIYEKNNK